MDGVIDTIQDIITKPGNAPPQMSDKKGKSPFIDGDIDEAAIASEVKREWNRRREERVTRELQWQLNREFLNGNQYCDINTITRTIEETPFIYDDEERETFNLIAPKIEARLAKLNKAKPALLVRPASDSHSDISTAKVSTKVLRGTYLEVGMQDQLKTANAWAEQCSVVFHKTVWNPHFGRIIGSDAQGDIHEGAVQEIVVPAFEVYPETEFKEHIMDNLSIIHAKPYRIHEIENLYGITIKGRTVDVYNLENSRIATGGMGYTATIQRYTRGRLQDAEVVIEMTYLSCKKYPRGKLITVVGDRVVVYMDNPWIDNDGNPYHPFTKQTCIRDPGNFWGRTIIERLIPLQRRYNALKNRIHEYINKTSVPAWTVELDTLIDKDSIRHNGIRAGDIIERQPGSAPPTALQMPQIGYDALNEDQRIRDLMTEISGVSDFAAQSQAPSGTPGVSLELIKQQDDSRTSLTSENIEIAAKEVGKHWLWLYKQHMKVPRMMKVVGDEYTLSYIMEWTQNDLTSFDVVLETEDLLTTSVANRRQQVIYLLSQGLFHDPVTKQIIPSMRQKLFEMFDLGNWEEAVSLENIHIRRANEENTKFKAGMVPQINPLDQDDLHVREHTRYALTTEFEDLASQFPEVRQFMFEHIGLHQMAQQQKLMTGQPMAQPMMPQQGQPQMLSQMQPQMQQAQTPPTTAPIGG